MKRVLLGYTNGAVTPSGITVSPALGINISRLDFNVTNEALEMPLDGFSRAAEISWSLLGDKPFLKMDFGPSVLTDYASADSIHIFTPALKEISWTDILIVSNIRHLKLNSLGQTEDFKVEGNVNFQIPKVVSVQLEAKSIIAEMDGSIYASKLIKGRLSDLNFHNLLKEQFFSGIFSVEDITVSEPKLSSPAATVNLSFNPDAKNLKIDFKELKFEAFGGSVENVKFEGNYDQGYVLRDLNINASRGVFTPGFPNFSDISTRIFKTEKNNYEARIDGSLSKYEISTSDNFLGLLPPSNFEIIVQSNKAKATVTSESSINFKNMDATNIQSTAALVLKSGSLSDIKCGFSNCALPGFDLAYKLDINDEWISGRAECRKASCGLVDLSFEVRTSDTVNIFKSLNKTGILSPLSSMYLYGIVGSGKKINKGHELKF